MNNLANKLKPILFGIALMTGVLSQAQAAGTVSGTTINNSASLSYSAGGVTQTAVPSTTASFVVDTKVSLTVTPQATYTSVVPGSTAQVTLFTVTNTGNSTNDFLLSDNFTLANGTSVYGKTDNFDLTTCEAYAGTGSTYIPATHTATYIDELAPDASRSVFVVCSVPATRINNDFAAVSLTAQAAIGGATSTQGAVLAATSGAKVLNTVAVVLGDIAGTDDLVNDGKVSARSGYLVQTATLTMSKTVVSYCDPVNFNNNPKLVPGAYAQYTINVSNASTSGSPATLGAVTDTLVSQLVFDPNLNKPTASSCSVPENAAGKGLKISCVGGTRACATTPLFINTSTVLTGQNVNANLGTLLPAEGTYGAGQLNPGESVNVIFNAIVQ